MMSLKRAFRISVCLLCVGLLGCVFALAQSQQKQQAKQQQQDKTQPDRTITATPEGDHPVKGVGQSDKKFIQQAAQGDMAEVELGQLAQQKSSDAGVKGFGERMVKDHSQNDDQLKALAQSKDVSLPTRLTQKQRSEKAQLSQLSGTKFDQAYMTLMVSEHTKDVNKFKQEAQSAHDPAVKQFAQASVPVLQSHLQQAKQVDSQVKSNPKQ